MIDPFEAYEQRIKKLEGVLADVAVAFDCKPDDHSDLIEAAKLLKREASAAPELLAALKGMIDMVEDDYGDLDRVPQYLRAKDVIAQVEGKVK